MIYAGIDEAGYGPMFGPLVVARCVFKLEGHDCERGGAEQAGPPSMWRVLRGAVCKGVRDKKRRIAVHDSKKLYSPATGLDHLERGVLAFLGLAGVEPGCVDELLTRIGHDAPSRTPDQLWYAHPEGGPALPDAADPGLLGIAQSRLRRAASRQGVSMPDAAAAVVFEDRFNQMVTATRSKARCSWTFVSQHLWAIWRELGEHHPWVVVDRQGGRKVYHELLGLMFEGANVRLLDESDDISRYVVSEGPRVMTISFETRSEHNHLPVALAGMTAKYVREVLMLRFNRFFSRHAPHVRPTAGYAQDGRRFLREIEPVIERLGIEPDQLIRSR